MLKDMLHSEASQRKSAEKLLTHKFIIDGERNVRAKRQDSQIEAMRRQIEEMSWLVQEGQTAMRHMKDLLEAMQGQAEQRDREVQQLQDDIQTVKTELQQDFDAKMTQKVSLMETQFKKNSPRVLAEHHNKGNAVFFSFLFFFLFFLNTDIAKDAIGIFCMSFLLIMLILSISCIIAKHNLKIFPQHIWTCSMHLTKETLLG